MRSSANRNSYQTCRVLYTVSLLSVLLVLVPSTYCVEINAAAFQLPPPPYLTGSLAINNVLTDAEKLHDGLVISPCSFAVYGDAIYTLTRNGQVVNIAPCRPVIVATLAPKGCRTTRECGYLVSIRTHNKVLLVLDSYRGLFEVHPETGLIKHIFDSSTAVNGRSCLYLNDMAFLPDGTIVLSDSSSRFDQANEFWIRFEGRADGRLIALNPASGQVKEILSGLAYPTGLEVANDNQALLVAEAGRARIIRLSLAPDKLFQKSTLNDNLPGMPEHLRRTHHGTYWVALTYPRYQGEVSIMDQYSNIAHSRNFLAKKRTREQLMLMYTRKGLAVELDGTGSVVSSIHDKDGLKVKDVCEVVEADGVLYVGTRDQRAVLRVVKYVVDLTVTSTTQILRSRCQLADDQLNVAKAALQRQLQTRKGMSSEGHILSNVLTGNNFILVLQNFAHQQRVLAARTTASPRHKLQSIRQGLTQIQNTLLRPATQRGTVQPGNTPLIPAAIPLHTPSFPSAIPQQVNTPNFPVAQTAVGPPSKTQEVVPDDPFLPLGVPPNIYIPPPRGAPQSYSSDQRPNADQRSPSSPFVVHRLDNGQLMTHVLVGNDFKMFDDSTSGKPTTFNRTVTLTPNILPTAPTPVPKAPSSRSPNIQSPRAPYEQQHSGTGNMGGFIDFMNVAPSQNLALDESTPATSLPDHIHVIQAENPYFLGPSLIEAYNNSPSDFGNFALHKHGSDASVDLKGDTSTTAITTGKSSVLRQGLQMLQKYFKQMKSAQTSHISSNQAQEPSQLSLSSATNTSEIDQQAVNATFQRPLTQRNIDLLSAAANLDKSELATVNDMVKRGQQVSLSGAAAIHPNQPINDVVPADYSPALGASTEQATTTGSDGQASSSFIKIVQGPGKYILIPLTQTTLLQALRAMTGNSSVQEAISEQQPTIDQQGSMGQPTQQSLDQPIQQNLLSNSSQTDTDGQKLWPGSSRTNDSTSNRSTANGFDNVIPQVTSWIEQPADVSSPPMEYTHQGEAILSTENTGNNVTHFIPILTSADNNTVQFIVRDSFPPPELQPAGSEITVIEADNQPGRSNTSLTNTWPTSSQVALQTEQDLGHTDPQQNSPALSPTQSSTVNQTSLPSDDPSLQP